MKKKLLLIGLIVVVAIVAMGVGLKASPDEYGEEEIQLRYVDPDTPGSELYKKLLALPDVSDIRQLVVDTNNFSEKYVLFVEQPLDPTNSEAGTFKQRVIVSHKGFDKPTLIVTEGYDAERDMYPRSNEELADIYDANIVVVEYRYYGESMPDPCNWDYLTVENSLCDLHKVRRLFGTIYDGKWISTGISKGGMTTMFYRMRFPNDVDISVPYVAPLNRAVEDGRHEPFIENVVGDERRREIVKNFQIELLKRKEAFMPMFKEFCDSKGYTFRLPIEEVYDYCVLEFSFAFWQWGEKIGRMPTLNASDRAIFDYFVILLDPDYFSEQTQYTSFNVQAVRELGYYGYDIEPFKEYIGIETAEDYMRRLMVLPEFENEPFDPTLYNNTVAFLENNDPKMVYIYGGDDPWVASGVTWLTGKENIHVYVLPGGSHGTRINTFPEPTRGEIIDLIRGWLDE